MTIGFSAMPERDQLKESSNKAGAGKDYLDGGEAMTPSEEEVTTTFWLAAEVMIGSMVTISSEAIVTSISVSTPMMLFLEKVR